MDEHAAIRIVRAVLDILESKDLAAAQGWAMDLIEQCGLTPRLRHRIVEHWFDERGLPLPDGCTLVFPSPEPPVTDPEPRVTDPEPRVADPEPRVTDPEPRVTGKCETCFFHRAQPGDKPGDRRVCENERSPHAHERTGAAESCDHYVRCRPGAGALTTRPSIENDQLPESKKVRCPQCGKTVCIQRQNETKIQLRPHVAKPGRSCPYGGVWVDRRKFQGGGA